MMFICESLMVKIWHFVFPEPCVVPFNSKVHTVLCVDKSLTVAVHSCVGH